MSDEPSSREANTVGVDGDLRVLGQIPPFREYLGDIWSRRHFALSVARGDLRRQSAEASLGQLWLILNPAMLVGIYYLVFEKLLRVDRGVDNFLGFLVIGILFFQHTQRIATDAASAISRNLGLVRSLQFPRILLPASVVLKESISFGQSSLVLVVTLALTGEVPDARWLVALPLFALQSVFSLGMALLTAQFGNRLRDTSQVLPHLFRILFYGSGVLFSLEKWTDDAAIRLMFTVNPLYALISLYRWSLMGGEADGGMVVSVVAWTVGLLVVGFLSFRRAEPRFGS